MSEFEGLGKGVCCVSQGRKIFRPYGVFIDGVQLGVGVPYLSERDPLGRAAGMTGGGEHDGERGRVVPIVRLLFSHCMPNGWLALSVAFSSAT